MLSSIRKFSKSFFAKIFIAIIALPFILWGMGDVFTSGKQNVLAEINDKDKISTKEFITYVQRVNIKSEEIKLLGKSKVLDQILTNFISEKIISLETNNKGLQLTDRGILKILLSDKEFQKDGKFSETKYEKFMIESGFTKPTYEKRIKDMELKGQLLTFYSGGIKLPKFIINEQFNKENTKKTIEYLDLSQIYNKKIIPEKDIKEFYDKNKKFFTKKYKKFKYLELTTEILTGKQSLDESYFIKIDKIENDILDGKRFDSIIPEAQKNIKIIEFVNSDKTFENGSELNEIEDGIVGKIFEIKNKNNTELITLNDKYFIAEIIEEKEVATPLKDQNLKKTITSQLKIVSMIEENKKIINKIKNNEFDKNKMIEFSKKNNIEFKKATIKNIRDAKQFEINLINQIYKYNKGQIFIISDSLMKKNYLVVITNEVNPDIDTNSDIYKANLIKTNSEYIKKVYQSYDVYINSKYKVNVNDSVFERIKNSF